MARPLRFCFALFVAIASGCAATDVTPVAVGDAVDFSALENQHGKPFTHQSAMQTLLYVGDMDAKEVVQNSLTKIDLHCVEQGRLVYVADISGMPTIISTVIAVPRMRDYPYPVWLDYDGGSTEALPAKENAVTLISIEQQQITDIDFIEDGAVLMKRLGDLCGLKAAAVQ